MLSTLPDDKGPKSDDRLRLVEYWCNVIGCLVQRHRAEYEDGDLRTRWAFYHAMGLIADTAKDIGPETRGRMVGVDWRGLSSLRTFLVHRPWDVDDQIVWQSATEDIPLLLTEVRRMIAERSG